MEWVVRTYALSKRFGSVRAVEKLDLHVAKGEIYGLLGPNGAGKTTTLHMLLGVLPATSGEIEVFGKPLIPEESALVRRRVGVMAEEQRFYDNMSAISYLRFFARLYGAEEAQNRILQLLQQLGLASESHRRLKEYSHGMRQKVAFARVLMHDPELVILDEPVSGLDPHGMKEIRNLILEENRRGTTFLISSHVLSEVEQTCHRVGILNRGRLVAEGSIDSLRKRLEDQIVYQVEAEGLGKTAVKDLQHLPFVKRATWSGQRLRITTDTAGDHRGTISRWIVQQGGTILGFRREQMSLEDAFITITQENISLLVNDGDGTNGQPT